MLPLPRCPALLAGALALALGLAGPAPAAIEWNWHEFLKYWQRQAGKTSSIVGIVLLVAAGATLIIISSKSRT